MVHIKPLFFCTFYIKVQTKVQLIWETYNTISTHMQKVYWLPRPTVCFFWNFCKISIWIYVIVSRNTYKSYNILQKKDKISSVALFWIINKFYMEMVLLWNLGINLGHAFLHVYISIETTLSSEVLSFRLFKKLGHFLPPTAR